MAKKKGGREKEIRKLRKSVQRSTRTFRKLSAQISALIPQMREHQEVLDRLEDATNTLNLSLAPKPDDYC